MAERRVLMVGLDGTTWDVCRRLAEDGTMPNLLRILDEGFGVRLGSVVQRVTPAAWATLSTGVPPQVHGVHDFRHYDPFTLEEGLAGSEHLRVPTIWQLVGDNAEGVVVVNLPVMYPPPALNGICVSGFDAPYGKGTVTHPADLEDELRREFPRFAELKDVEPDRAEPDWREGYTRRAIAATVQEGDVGLYCLDKVDWRLAMVQFQTVDAFQHAMWSEVEADPLSANAREFYASLDEQVGRLAKAARARSASIVIASDHGFQRSVGRVINVNSFLESLGLLRRRPGKRLRHCLLRPLRRLMDRARRKLSRRPIHADRFGRRTVSGLNLDWPATRAYVPLCHVCAYVYVNRQGREPGGAVPAQEVDQVAAEVRQAALGLVDPATGAPVFQAALTRGQAFDGSGDLRLPELVLVPTAGYSSALNLEPSGSVFEQWEDGEGVHAPDGMLAAAGPAVRRRGFVDGPHPALENIAPCVLRLLGFHPPDYMAGCGGLADFFEFPEVRKELGGYVLESERRLRVPAGMSEEQEASVRKRLRDLGYLG